MKKRDHYITSEICRDNNLDQRESRTADLFDYLSFALLISFATARVVADGIE
jgi:hypothetical protein